MRLAVVASHPIQYQAPILRALVNEPGVDLHVYFGYMPDAASQGRGFGVQFQWDVPVLDGYPFDVFAQDLNSSGDVARLVSAWSKLRRAWREKRPDVVLHTGWHHPCMLPALAAARRLRIPCLLRCEANPFSRRGMVKQAWHRWVLRRYAAFLPIGKANAAYYDAFGPRETPRSFSPYASGGQFDGVQVTDRRSARERFGIFDDDFCFLFAGKLEPKKRPFDVLHAAARVLKELRIRVLFVGSGQEEAELRREAESLSDAIVFAGFLNQSAMPWAYVAADCLVLPSDSGETWGLVVNEAMGFGVPAIVSDEVGCASDLVEPGETGWIFRCRDVDGLASCMSRMASDPAEAERMGSRARKRVAAYTAENAARGILEAARAVAGSRARTGAG